MPGVISLDEFLAGTGLDVTLLDLALMPTPLALLWQELWVETHPRVRLHWLTDTLEMTVRWGTAIALAETLHAHDDALPGPLLRALRDHVERPTLGRWIHMLRELTNDLADAEPEPRGISALSAAVAAACPRNGSIDTSLLELRNHVAHGGGIVLAQAEDLLDRHLVGLARLLSVAVAATRSDRLLAQVDGSMLLLQGPSPQVLGPSSSALPPGAWVERGDVALPLSPMVLFGPLQRVTADGSLREVPGVPGAQVYSRLERDRVTYTPVGRSEPDANTLDVDSLRALFGLDQARVVQEGDTPVQTPGFLSEARGLSEQLVGRRVEISRAWEWLDTRTPWGTGHRIAWITAGPGTGKSMLMARLATMWADKAGTDPRSKGLYLHRFRGGDARNSRRAFLQGLMAALTGWSRLATDPPDRTWEAHDLDELVDDVVALLQVHEERAPDRRYHKKARTPHFVIMADGLDEIASHDPGFAIVLRALASPGVSLVVAGRPELGLDAAFSGDDCTVLFPGGLGPMADEDIHAMLLVGLGNARYALLARDEDEDRGVHNVFVERVVDRAHGLPLYVHLLLQDLRAGAYTVHDEDRLPDGLNAYYDDLVQRMGLSTVQRDLPLMIATLAVAEEPLDSDALAWLLSAPYFEDEPIFAERVAAALRVGTALLRSVPTPEGTAGHALYHQSFREYVAGRDASGDSLAIPPCPALAETVAEARRRLFRTAALWRELPDGGLRRHLFRWGTEYALWWQPMGASLAAGRLVDFAYLQSRARHLSGADINDLITEYSDVGEALAAGTSRDDFDEWIRFVRERAHALRRGDGAWSTDRILLQLAVEQADDSPVTTASEVWMDETGHPGPALCAGSRPARLERSNLVHVLEGHDKPVQDVLVDQEQRLVTAAKGGEVRVWDAASGLGLLTIEGSDWQTKCHLVGPGRLVTADSELWDLETCRSLGRIDLVATGEVLGVAGCLVSAGPTGQVHLVCIATGEILQEHRFGDRPITGVAQIQSDRSLAWGRGGAFWVWDTSTGRQIAEVKGPRGEIKSVHPLPDGRMVLHKGKALLVLEPESATTVGSPAREEDLRSIHVVGDKLVTPLISGAIVVWSTDPLVRVGRFERGEASATNELHTDRAMLWWGTEGLVRVHGDSAAVTCSRHWSGEVIEGVLVLEDGTLLVTFASDSRDGALHIDPSTDAERFFCANEYPIKNATLLLTGQILARKSAMLCAWRPNGSVDPLLMKGHKRAVRGTVELPGDRLLSYAGEPQMFVWSLLDGQVTLTLDGHTGPIRGARRLAVEHLVLTWSDDQSVICWDTDTGEVLSRTTGPGCDVSAFHDLDHGLLLSTSASGTLRLWEGDGRARAILEGHDEEVEGWCRLGDDRLITWQGGWDVDAETAVRVWSTRASIGNSADCGASGHTGTVWGLADLDAQRLLSWGADRSLRLWERRDGRAMGLFAEHPGDIDGVRVLDGSTLLTWTEKKPARLYLWDLDARDQEGGAADRSPRAILKGHSGNIRSVEVLDDGKILSRGPKRFVVWDPATGRVSHRFPSTGELISTRAYLHGRRLVEVATGDGHHIAVWDPVQGQVLSSIPVADSVELVVSDDGDVFVFAPHKRRLSRWTPGQPASAWTRDTGPLVEQTESLETMGGFVQVGSREECRVWGRDGSALVRRPPPEWAGPGEETDFGLVAPGLLFTHRRQAGVLLALDLQDGGEIGRLAFSEFIAGSWREPTYLSLAGGRILSRFWGYARGMQGALTWNPHTGEHARLQIGVDIEPGTIQLDDGRCVSPLKGGDLVAWCPETGAVRHRGSPRALLRTAPEVVTTWITAKAPHQVRDGTTAVADREGVIVRHPDGSVAEWHASGDWTIHAIEPDGRILVTGGTSVLVLKVPGAQRQLHLAPH